MKKPNLREQFEEVTGMVAYGRGINCKIYSDAYVEWLETINSKMIDALVDAHGTLESLTYSGADKFVVEEELKNIEQALKKAGCTNES